MTTTPESFSTLTADGVRNDVFADAVWDFLTRHAGHR
jgi:hypothetical protein